MNYAQSNYLNDVVMPNLKNGNAFMIVHYIARETWGAVGRPQTVELSYADIMNQTGIKSVNTIKTAIKIASEYITQDPGESGYRYGMKPMPERYHSTMSKFDTPYHSTMSDIDTPEQEGVSKNDTHDPGTMSKFDRGGVSKFDTPSIIERTKINNTPPIIPPTPQNEPFEFQPLPEKHKTRKKSPADVRTAAIITVCGLDSSVPSHVRQAENAAAQLSSYSGEYIMARYGPDRTPNGSWYWYRDDFRGKQGDMPSIKFLIDTISKARQKAAAVNSSQEEHFTDIIARAASEEVSIYGF